MKWDIILDLVSVQTSYICFKASDKPIRHILIKRSVGMTAVKMTEEKVRKLLPIIESILSREYGRKVTLKDLTVGGITVYKNDCAK